MGKIYNIAQFGAFDVNSFGDSMFPVAARTELAKRVTVGEFILFSPVGAEESYNVNGRVYAYGDFNALHQKIGFDLIIIGGGEMFHFNPIAFDNKKDGRTEYAPGYIWREPVRYAMDHKIPYLFFGVGAPFSFSGEERDEVYHAVMHAVYTGVRDIYSLQRVEEVMKGKGSLTLQPDGLWLLDSYFDQKELEQARNKLRRQKGSFAESKYMVVQYGTTYQYRAVAKELKKVAKAKEWKIVLLPVNYCHEDIWALRLFYEELGKEADFYDKLLQPLEITALISGAKFFVGTSLHGNLVASLYGVKNLVFDMYGTFVSKMDGFLYWKGEVQHTTIQPECISGDIEKILASPPNIEQAEEIRRKLAICYDSMARAIKGEGQEPFVSADNGGIPAGQKCYFTIYPDCGEIFSGVAIGQIEQNLITFSLQLPKGKQANGMEVCLPLKEAVQLNIIACRDEGGDVPYEYQNIIQPGFICLEKIAKVKILCSGAKELSITAELKTDGKEQILSQFFEHYNNMKNELEQVRGLQLQAEEKMQFYRGEAECKKAHIEQLMQSERELQSQLDAVHNSRTWRAASLLHKPVLWLLPADSKRRLFAKMFVRLARHPVNSVKMLSPMKIRHFVTFLKEEGPAFVSQRMDESMLGVKIRKTELDLEPMDEKKPFEEYGPLYFNEEPKPVVSIVIPVYNQFSYTYHCLQSILKNSGEEISYEVIIMAELQIQFPEGNIDMEYAQWEMWERHEKEDWFLGSWGKRVGQFFGGTDPLIWYTPQFETSMSCSIPKHGELHCGDFSAANIRTQYIEQRDLFGYNPYCVYIGGDYPLVQHRNLEAPSELRLLILKDSFTLPLQSYFSTVFQEVDVIDPRYFTECSIAEYAEWTRPDIVLFMINPSSLGGDKYKKLGTEQAIANHAREEAPIVSEQGDIVLASDSSNNYRYATIPLEADSVYRVTFDCVDVVEGSPDGVALTLYNRTKEERTSNRLFDLNYYQVMDGYEWTFRTPKTEDTLQLLFYAGIYGSTAGNGLIYRNVILEKM